MRRKILSGALLGSMASGLAGCGDDPGDRAVSGGLVSVPAAVRRSRR